MTLDVQETIEVDASPYVFLNALQDAVYIVDRRRQIVYWNDSAERVYGWSRHSAVGQEAGHLLYEAENDQFNAALTSVQERGAWSGEHRQMTLQGVEIVVDARWSIIPLGHLHAGDVLVVNTDITDRRKQQMKLLRTQRLGSLGTLASGIAHDMNNILGPIMMSLQMIESRLDDAKSREIIEVLASSTRRGAEMLKQVLLFARGMEGGYTLLSLGPLMQEIHALLASTLPPSIALHLHIEKGIDAVRGDPTQVHQVIMNLCVNARDALPEGGHIWIKARNIVVGKDAAPPVPDARPGRFVVLSVSDNGHGMSPETMASAFEPFYSTKDEGTGLGLSTLLGIVRGHQGFVEVESRLGFGTTFRVYLPAMHEPSRPGETKKARSPQKGRGDLILFVDDDEAYRLTMQAALSEQGFRVIVAQDGREGAALYRTYQDQIGVVITDLMMPVLDGAGLIEAVRALNASVPVVLISGGRGEEELADALRDQIVDFLGKPFEAHRLLETLHNVLG